jgi:YVTN family beta-propeller protein
MLGYADQAVVVIPTYELVVVKLSSSPATSLAPFFPTVSRLLKRLRTTFDTPRNTRPTRPSLQCLSTTIMITSNLRLIKNALIAFMGWSLLLLSGCGDTFRPTPNLLRTPSPDPQDAHLVELLSSSPGANGISTEINSSGDTVVGQLTVGHNPVYAFVNSGQVITANQDDDSVSQYTRIFFTGSTDARIPFLPSVATTSLNPGSKPAFVVQARSNVYVANSGLGTVGVITAGTLASEMAVGSNPIALAALSNGSKVYCVNHVSGNVSVISTLDNTVVATVSVGASPVWAVSSADNARVFVVNQGSNNVSVIDTGSDTVVATIAVGTGPNYATFDSSRQRVYVTNPGSNNLSILNADPNSGLGVIATVAVGATPLSVTALADGSRAYVANSGDNSVSVINTLSNTVTKTISVGTNPVWISSSGDSRKVYTANRRSQDVSVIRTINDSEITDASGNVMRIPLPKIDSSCTSNCVRQTPISVNAT